MSELSSALGGSAPKHHIHCNGKQYPVNLITQAVKVAYEKALFEKARTVIASMKTMFDRDQYAAKVDQLADRYTEGYFAMESEYGQKSLKRPGGSVLLLSILMGQYSPQGEFLAPMPELDVINIVSQVPEEAGAVFKVVMTESFPGVDVEKLSADVEGQADPKAQGTAPRNPPS